MAQNDNPVTHSDDKSSVRDFYKRRPAWLSTPVKVLIGVAILVSLVFAGRAIHHALKSKPAAQTNTGSTSQTASKPATTPNPTPSGTSSSAGSSSTPASGSAAKPQPGPAASQVPNTGPGDTAALFVISSAVGAGAHYLYQRKKRA